MPVIRISHIKPGQIILSNVKDRSGRVLLLAGSELTDANIKIIKSWGVAEVDIEGDDLELLSGSKLENVSPQELEKAEIELSNRFRFLNKNHPFSEELYLLCLRRVLLDKGLVDAE